MASRYSRLVRALTTAERAAKDLALSVDQELREIRGTVVLLGVLWDANVDKPHAVTIARTMRLQVQGKTGVPGGVLAFQIRLLLMGHVEKEVEVELAKKAAIEFSIALWDEVKAGD